MEFRTIKRGDLSRITPHFRNNEFFSTSSDAPNEHTLAQPVISAAELLRTYFNTPWRVTSTYRTEAHELAICEKYGMAKQLAKTSQHVLRRALDSQPVNGSAEIMVSLHRDFLDQGELFTQLRQMGITGFGIYDTFVHLDCRGIPGKQHDKYGTFAFWDERSDEVKKKLRALSKATTKPNPTKPRVKVVKPSLALSGS